MQERENIANHKAKLDREASTWTGLNEKAKIGLFKVEHCSIS